MQQQDAPTLEQSRLAREAEIMRAVASTFESTTAVDLHSLELGDRIWIQPVRAGHHLVRLARHRGG